MREESAKTRRYVELAREVRQLQRRIFRFTPDEATRTKLRAREAKLKVSTDWILKYPEKNGSEITRIAVEVAEMFRAQGKFLAGDRSGSTVAASKRRESAVDDLIERVLDPQLSLFDEGNDPR